ncbi:hypothetical protein JM16_001274, partial [Phytophthora kernoviae]
DNRLSWFYIRLLLLTGASWAVHAAELVLFTFTRRLVAHNVGMGTHALETLGVGAFLGSAMGGPLFGYFADIRGRRSALLFAMTLSLAGLALSAAATKDYHIIVARVIAGVGLGGELPAATVLVQELAPRGMRGRMVALLEAFTGIGGVLGVMLAFGLAPRLGWRTTYLAICSCVLYTGVLRFGIPESPRWLASIGRVEEALAVVGKLESEHGKRSLYDNVKTQEPVTPVTQVASSSFALNARSSVFDKPVHTLMLWTLWTVLAMSSYALGVYVPTLISLSGFNMYERWSTIALLHAAKVLGCILAASTLEKHGRKESLACFVTMVCAVSVMLSYLPWYRFVVIAGTCTVSALLAGSWSCVLANTPETYTTGIRARGVAYAFGFSRLGASGGVLLCPRMFDKWLLSVQVITWVFAGLLTISVLGIIVPYGSDPVIRGYEFGASSVHDSDTDLESSVEGKEGHLLVNNLGEHKTIPLHYKVEEDMEFLQVEREPEPQSVKDLHEQ